MDIIGMEYDRSSLMHYSTFSVMTNRYGGQMSTRKDPWYAENGLDGVDGYYGLSRMDILHMKRHYDCQKIFFPKDKSGTLKSKVGGAFQATGVLKAVILAKSFQFDSSFWTSLYCRVQFHY